MGEGANRYPGDEMIARLWDRAVSDSLLLRRQDNFDFALREIELATAHRPNAADLIEEMLSLGTVTRRPDGSLVDSQSTQLLGWR